ncbi:MAG: class I SAM-dependent methyltransferase [Candidatus Methylomirabilales bacterium]
MKRNYQDRRVAAGYAAARFHDPIGRLRNFLKFRAIRALLDGCEPLDCILDMPCGTGRFTARLPGRSTIGLDVSLQMLREAERVARENVTFVQGDVEDLPFSPGAFDCVVTIRFLRHLPRAERIKVFGRLGEVTRRWIVFDFLHRSSWKALVGSIRASLGLRVKARERLSGEEVAAELREAGLRPVAMLPCLRFWSEKWVVLAERA